MSNILGYSILHYFADFLRRIVGIVKLVNGEPCVVQVKNSQVKLHVPKGVYGAILANIHTNHARFVHHVPDDHCLVAPICEYHLQQPYRELLLGKKIKVNMLNPVSEDIIYRIEMPHIVKDVDNVRPSIRVRHGNLRSGVPALEKFSPNVRGGKSSLYIDEELVIINTNHFSGYMVTAKCINCCGKSAFVHVFGSLRNIPEAKPLATVKVYLSSIHGGIDDYQFVSIFPEINKCNSIRNIRMYSLSVICHFGS